MRQLVYMSEAEPGLESSDIFQIVQTSAANNAKDGLTGFLLFRNGVFFQLVEGEQNALHGLLDRLERDMRHRHIRVIDDSEIEARAFAQWRMKRLRDDTAQEAVADVAGAVADERRRKTVVSLVERFYAA